MVSNRLGCRELSGEEGEEGSRRKEEEEEKKKRRRKIGSKKNTYMYEFLL
jgi:hypothetical protein